MDLRIYLAQKSWLATEGQYKRFAMLILWTKGAEPKIIFQNMSLSLQLYSYSILYIHIKCSNAKNIDMSSEV